MCAAPVTISYYLSTLRFIYDYFASQNVTFIDLILQVF